MFLLKKSQCREHCKGVYGKSKERVLTAKDAKGREESGLREAERQGELAKQERFLVNNTFPWIEIVLAASYLN
jgi:hypothetical protein